MEASAGGCRGDQDLRNRPPIGARLARRPKPGVVARVRAAQRGQTKSDARSRRILENLLKPIDCVRAKEWAIALMAEFGALGDVLSATPAAQARVLRSRAARTHLGTVRAAVLQLLLGDAMTGPRLNDGRALIDYLRVRLAHERSEHFRVLFLGVGNRLIRDELLAVGSPSETVIDIRRIMIRTLELGASGLILVHNHPSGDPEPSRSDIVTTRRICDAAATLGIIIHDHIVVARDGCTSFRVLGLA